MTNRRRSTGQQPGTKSASRPADKPRVNRGFSSSAGVHRIFHFRASEEVFRTVVFDALEDTRDGCVLRGETRRRSILPGPPCPAAPLCAARPDPPVVCPGFGFGRFVLHRISFFRAYGETFRRCVRDALEGTRDACLLGGLFCRRPVLTDPAPPPRRALRPDLPVVCSGFRIDRSVSDTGF